MSKRKQPPTAQTRQLPLGLSPPDPPIDRLLDSLTLAEQRYLSGPLIQPRLNGWDFPDRLRAIVPAARCLQILRGQVDANEKDLASEEEAIGYLSCASLDAPLAHDWAEIFFYLGQQVFPRWHMIQGESVHHALGYDRPITLNQQQVDDLRHFRRWLRQKIAEGAKRDRSHSRKNPIPTEEIHETCPVVSQTNTADR
jgi:hypothetical protein